MKHRRLISRLTGAGVTLAFTGFAFAADAAHGAEDAHGVAAHGGGGANPVAVEIVPFVSALLVFGIAFGVLAKFVWPKLLSGLEEREKKIRDEIFAAEEARSRANEALKEYEKSLGEARAEANRMIEATKAEQARMAADLKAKAESEVGQLRESAMQSIDAATRAALSEIYAEAASLATAVASRILEREVNEQDQQRLVDETVAGIAARDNGSTTGGSPEKEEVVHGSTGHTS